MTEILTSKEKLAIELKYLEVTYEDISLQLEVPITTIQGWFEQNGKLYQQYLEFATDMNAKKQRQLEDKLAESDENILKITTNVMRQIGKRITEDKINLNIADFERAWKMQRVMLGKITDYTKEKVEETGLEDFTEEEKQAYADDLYKRIKDGKSSGTGKGSGA